MAKKTEWANRPGEFDTPLSRFKDDVRKTLRTLKLLDSCVLNDSQMKEKNSLMKQLDEYLAWLNRPTRPKAKDESAIGTVYETYLIEAKAFIAKVKPYC